MTRKPDDDFAERADAFLADLRRITMKHGIHIAGCGCFGTPFLSGLGSKQKQKAAKNRYRHDGEYGHVTWE
jgi:hypothetical protein